MLAIIDGEIHKISKRIPKGIDFKPAKSIQNHVRKKGTEPTSQCSQFSPFPFVGSLSPQAGRSKIKFLHSFTRPIPNYVHDKNINSRVFHIDISGAPFFVSLPRDASNNWLRWKPHSATNPFPPPPPPPPTFSFLIHSPSSSCTRTKHYYKPSLPFSGLHASLPLALTSLSVSVLEDPEPLLPGPLSRPRGNSRGIFTFRHS